MKTAFFAAGLVVCLLAGFVIAEQGDATAEQASVDEPVAEQTPADVAPTCENAKGEPLAKKCSFNSDCSHGKCKSGKCGGCSFKSDCKGWGKCSKGQCGACSFDSECKGFGKCTKGKCTKSPYKK